MTFPPRHGVSRARLFPDKACACAVESRDDCDAFLEAAIVFARAGLHRARTEHRKHPAWPGWWKSLESDPAVQFFRKERDCLLKEAPPRVGQVIRFGGEGLRAADLYYYESPDVPATQTIRRHLDSFEVTLIEAERRFSAGRGDAI